jgi:hypothetical protein
MIRSVVLSCLICFFHLSLAERLLLTEPFESVTLQPHGGEGMGNDRVWSLTTPPGWSLNDAGVPAVDGRPGWGGWRFVDGAWWKTLRDDPWRGLFRRAGGTLLVADADAWSAESRVPGTMTSFLSTPPIPISHLTAERFEVRFDSSWHPVAPMAGNLSVSFDGMPAIELLRYESNPNSPSFQLDTWNQRVRVLLQKRPGVASFVLTLGILHAGQGGWWAIDNLEVVALDEVDRQEEGGHWLFNSERVHGAFVEDLEGGLYPGNLKGPATLHETGGLEGLWLDGMGPPVQVESPGAPRQWPSREITLEAWLALAAPARFGGILSASRQNVSPQEGWVLGFNSARFTFGLASGTHGRMTFVEAQTPYELGQWYHVVGTYDGITQRIYLNGKLEGTDTSASGEIRHAAAAPLLIGAHATEAGFRKLQGIVHEVRVHPTAMDPAGVSERFERHATEVDQALVLPEISQCQTAIPRNNSPFGTRRVLIIGVDGCRVDSLQAAATPHLDALAASGASSFNGRASIGQPTVSGPGWTTLLTGVWSGKHKVLNNTFSGREVERYPHVFERIRHFHPDAYLSSWVHWAPINAYILSAETVQMPGDSDASLSAKAACHILNEGPDVLYIHLDELDVAGHGGGFHPGNPHYLATLSRLDGYIGKLMDAVNLRRSALGEDWLVVFCTDHGGTSAGSHGGLSLVETQVPLIIQGAYVPSGNIHPAPLNTDVVPTLLAHLEIEVPSSWGLDGRTVGVIPELSIKAGDEDVTLQWPGIATLQSTSSLKDWEKVPHARSPYVYHPSSDQVFFRLVP